MVNVGRQSGFEFEVGVGGTDDNLVGDDVVGRRGLLAHLLHRTSEGVVGIGIDGEGDALASLDLADVGLITSATTCMLVRSLAMVKSSGVEKLAATVCPSSTLLDRTTPSIGAGFIYRREWINLSNT